MSMLPAHEQKVVRILAAIERELAGKRQVIVGPWIGEVGFETLYWIPFVRWALDTFRVAPERVIVVSRGGTASWYSGIGSGAYVDAFEVMSPEELTSLIGGGKPKQKVFDDAAGDQLLERVKASRGLGNVARLLPHWMYKLFRLYWADRASFSFLEQHAVWARFTPPEPDALWNLPPRYVAVRFYFSRSMPDEGANRQFAETMIDRLSSAVPVVLLNQPFQVDDHRDYQPNPTGSVVSVAGQMAPASNLAVQTAVIGRASAFVGTYGGLSLVPPLCAVPSFAFQAVAFTKRAHERAIRRMIEQADGAPLRVADIRDGVAQADAVLAVLADPAAGRPSMSRSLREGESLQ
jgi:hypothetical protein